MSNSAHASIDRKLYWDNAYQNKPTNQTGWFQKIPQVSLDLINSTGLAKSAKILDIGGGDSLLIDHLLNLGFENITIVDVSDLAIKRAKKRLGKNGSKVNWVVSDILDFQSSEKYDLWHDRACLHFLTSDQEIARYYKLVEHVMANKGTVILGVFSKSGPTSCSGLPIKQFNSTELNQFASDSFELLESFETVHLTPSNARQNYVFCRFKKD